MKTFVISDIHGCYKELMALYKKLPIDPKVDRMVFLGDYIDRGPDSKKVISQLIKWKNQYPHWVVLYGNHEDFMVETLVRNTQAYGDQPYNLWMYNGGEMTLRSYLPKGLTPYERATIGRLEKFIPKNHLYFLANLPRYYEDGNYIFVHGGLKPGKTAQDTDPFDLIWIRDEFILSDYDWGKKVIFGHTAKSDFTPWVMPNKIGIDTAVCPPRRHQLTALELPSEKFYSQTSL